MRVLQSRRLGLKLALLVLLPGGLVLLTTARISQRVAVHVAETEIETRARQTAVQAAVRLRVSLDTFEDAAANLLSDLAVLTEPGAGRLTVPAVSTILERMIRVHPDVHAIGVVWRHPADHGRYQIAARNLPKINSLTAGMGDGAPPPDELLPAEASSATEQGQPAVAAPAEPASTAEALVTISAEPEAGSAHWAERLPHLRAPAWLTPSDHIGRLHIVYTKPLVAAEEAPPALQRALAGVIVLLPLPRVATLLQTFVFGSHGAGFLITEHGQFLGHPDLLKKDLQAVPPALAEASSEPLPAQTSEGGEHHLDTAALAANVAFLTLPAGAVLDTPVWVATCRVPRTAWRVGIAEDITAHRASLARLNLYLNWVAALGLFMLCLGAALTGQAIARPIRRLDQAAGEIAAGNLDLPVPLIAGRDELAHLGQSFETMRRELQRQIEERARAERARERIESEVRIARGIQMSLLPRDLPPHDAFTLAADLIPAREVGGDLYDIQLLDPRTLFLAVGDVTDKGVPAALFMAVTRTFLRSILREERSPATLLARLNDAVAEDNESSMFVTVFAALIDLPSGVCRYSSGGHNPPLLLRRDAAPEPIGDAAGMALGVLPGLAYPEGSLNLGPGDGLFCYTDGVTEAMSATGELFGLSRTIATLAELPGADCQQQLAALAARLAAHARGAAQSDDITTILLRYRGRE